jgi:hypothetical protein
VRDLLKKAPRTSCSFEVVQAICMAFVQVAIPRPNSRPFLQVPRLILDPLRLCLEIADFVDAQATERADEYTVLALAHGWSVKAKTLVHRIQMERKRHDSWREQTLHGLCQKRSLQKRHLRDT